MRVGSGFSPVGVASSSRQPLEQKPAKRLQFSGMMDGRQVSSSVTLFFAGAQRKLMTYNTLNLKEPKRPCGDDRNVKSCESIQALADVILAEDPDVIAFQEITPNTLRWFNQTYLKNRYPNIAEFAPKGAWQRVAIVSKRNMRMVSKRSHLDEVHKTIKYQGMRDFTEAVFETETGFRFRVFVAHCKSMYQGEKETNPTRQGEVTAYRQILDRRLGQDPKMPIFVAGDFNILPDSPYGKPLIEQMTSRNDGNPHNDLFEVMLDGVGKIDKTRPNHTHAGEKNPDGTVRYKPAKLDYIFVSQAARPLVVQSYVAGRFDQDPWQKASDHLPLVTVFEEPDIGAKAQGQKLDRVA